MIMIIVVVVLKPTRFWKRAFAAPIIQEGAASTKLHQSVLVVKNDLKK